MAGRQAWADAARKLLELEAEYHGTGKAAAVKTTMEELAANASMKSAIEARRVEIREEAAADALDDVKGLEKRKQWDAAIAGYDAVAAKHGGTRAAEEAVKLRQELDTAAAEPCRKLMSAAESFVKNGVPALAKKKYQEVIDKYPGTSYAAEAKKKLESLK